VKFSVLTRSQSGGKFEISDKLGGEPKAVAEISPTENWTEFSVPLDMGEGVSPLFLKFIGENAELKEIGFTK
ncbi:MAG: hypothetical protein K2N71_03875, partial [Oscillospiraceae bacterium]|nr:hypothetical protein [Oscillospiraceae bacterium]